MSAIPVSRVNYFDRQYIRLAELTDEQAYHLQLHRRHNLSHHSWGIVAGLELVLQEERPVVLPGLAVDGYGRELLLAERLPLGRDTFDRLGTSRIDLWLEYRLTMSTDASAPLDEPGAERQPYRAIERAVVVPERARADTDPRRPPGVPAEAFEAPMLATPDDPALRWPVYLGRIAMQVDARGPSFTLDPSGRVHAGLNAELIDHPGNACRIELGHRPDSPESRILGSQEIKYAGGSNRDFAVFVPNPETEQDSLPLQPVLSIQDGQTCIRGSAEVHGNLLLDGTALQFTAAGSETEPNADGLPAIYRVRSTDKSVLNDDVLRIDIGNADEALRALVIGVTKDGRFVPALTVSLSQGGSDGGQPLVTVHGELRIEGSIQANDIRARTVTQEVAALLNGLVQGALATGSGAGATPSVPTPNPVPAGKRAPKSPSGST